ncbi:MAG TPA: type II toxin-antitoxin system PemK/MazF family toxin [Tepidisphaeraceae bacterium]|jgi:mRNA interferase MazF
MVIGQGDVFWVDLPAAGASEPAFRHPMVVVQNNAFNHSRISTVVLCALTSNLQRANSPGNVLLAKGEAGLPKRSVVNISQLVTLDKTALAEKIGTISRRRLGEILDGIALLLSPSD